MTARYLVPDLPIDIDEEILSAYFSELGDLEEVVIKTLGEERRMGSVKFLSPTAELRSAMLNQQHFIGDHQLTVQTWKMQKLQKSGGQAAAKKAPQPVQRAGMPLQGKAAGKGLGTGSSFGVKIAPSRTPGGSVGYGATRASPAVPSRPTPYGAGTGKGLGEQSQMKGGGDLWEMAFWMGAAYAKGQDVGSWIPPARGKGPGLGSSGVIPIAPSKRPLSAAGSSAVRPAISRPAPSASSNAARGRLTSGHSREEPGYGLASRYLIGDLPATTSEEEIGAYFGTFGQVEEATIKLIGESLQGSVKFANPTLELRKIMLEEQHELGGQPVTVATWKMKKLAKPGHAAA